MNRLRTRLVTLHRLTEVVPTRDGIFEALIQYVGAQKLDERRADLLTPDVDGHPAVWIGFQDSEHTATWCADASATIGAHVSYHDAHSGGVLLIALDGNVYEISYGSGRLIIPDELRDQRFGLRFLIRCLDPARVQDLVRRRPDARGRTDFTLIPAGTPVWTLGVMESAQIVRRIGGLADGLDVTYATKRGTGVKVTGATGLQMRFGVEPAALVTDIREVERLCRERKPDDALAFIDYIQPVGSEKKKAELDDTLDELLGTGGGDGRIVPVVPVAALERFGEAHSFTFRIGPGKPIPRERLELEHFLQRTRIRPAGARVNALRRGYVVMNADDDGTEVLYQARADRWLEASVSDGEGRRFFSMEGQWYEIGDQYVRAARDEIARLFAQHPSLDLPPWYLPSRRDEGDYNANVPCVRTGYVCLDKNKRVRDPLGPSRSSLEVCDLLGPNNELVHVKRAKGSAPLSHLFSQGLVSAQTLIYGPRLAREQFATEVAHLGGGRVLPTDYRPKKVVFAILMENGAELTVESLFPFSQVTLAHVARVLGSYGIDVEVIGIPAAFA
jgi:uncharacterized protein (TIGR04141 family)